jgi:hypothetical protein
MTTVGKRFELVIGPQARRALHIEPGDRAVQIVDGNRLIVYLAPRSHRRTLRGRLSGGGSIEDFAAYRDGDALPEASTCDSTE